MDHNMNDSDRKIPKEEYEYMEEFPEDMDIDEYMLAEALEYRDVWIRRIILIISIALMCVLAVFVTRAEKKAPINQNQQAAKPSEDFLVISLINEDGILVSSVVTEYLKTDLLDEKNAGVTPSQFLTQSERWDRQKSVGIHLSTKNVSALYYKVELSERSDFNRAEIFYAYTGGSYAFKHLYANTQYFYRVTVYTSEGVDSETGAFTTADTPRLLSIGGLYNVRDIGNWMTDSGKRIKQGLLIRGTEMDGAVESGYHLTNEGLEDMLDVFGIKMDMDLRAQEPGTMDALGSRVEHKYYDMVMYLNIFNESGKEKIREVFADLANPDNYPIYMHCTYGRDRTGTVCYLLEALLGVSEEDCLKDYGLSNATIANIKLVENGLRAYEGDTLKEQTESYLLSCGITEEQIQSLRNIFLGD